MSETKLDCAAFISVDGPIIALGLSKREYAAIHLRVPMSGNEELDKMIDAARRDRFAVASLALMQRGDFNFEREYSDAAYKMADAMLAASKGEK